MTSELKCYCTVPHSVQIKIFVRFESSHDKREKRVEVFDSYNDAAKRWLELSRSPLNHRHFYPRIGDLYLVVNEFNQDGSFTESQCYRCYSARKDNLMNQAIERFGSVETAIE